MKKFLLTSLLLLLPLQVFAQTSIISKDTGKQLYRIKDVGEDNDEIILGDEKSSSTYKPKITFTKWKNPKTNLPENSLSIRYDGISGTPTLSSGQLKLANNEQEFYCLPVEDGLKFGVNFLKKPATNKITFYLEGWEEFDFFYQEPWGNYKIISFNGEEYLEKTDEPKKGAWRKENVQGSYAIYHKTKRDHIIGQVNYKIGKFGHYFRPKFIDANNKEIWADLNIKDGIVNITIPQDFLDKAKYPIKSNDDFGTTSAPPSIYNGGAIHGAKYQAPANGTVTSISVFLDQYLGTSNVNFGYYNDNAGAVGTHVAHGTSTNAGDPNYAAFPINVSGSITSGNYYWLLWEEQTNGNYHWLYDDGAANQDAYSNDYPGGSYDTWNNAPTVSYYAYIEGIYATYTPTPSSSIKTIDGLAKASVKTVNGLAIGSVKSWDGLQ